MRRLLIPLALAAGLASSLLGYTTVDAAPPVASGTITLNESGPYAFGDNVTFTTSVSGLKGYQHPMVYVVCYADTDGALLYGMLDHPDAVFLLGGSWSPWWDIGGDGMCSGRLYAYGKGAPVLLAETESFAVTGP